MLVFVYTKKTIEVLICNLQNFHCVVPFHCFFNQNFTGNNFRKYYIDCQKISNLFGQALETGRMRFAFLACFPARANKIYIYWQCTYIVFIPQYQKPKITENSKNKYCSNTGEGLFWCSRIMALDCFCWFLTIISIFRPDMQFKNELSLL